MLLLLYNEDEHGKLYEYLDDISNKLKWNTKSLWGWREKLLK